jgi:para-aminobenzoate synthetase/4-amino-4-deoxychorismate lyase
MHAAIDWACPDGGDAWQHGFDEPIAVLQAQQLHQVRPVLDAVHAHAQAGRWCVGYVSFEAAPAFDEAFVVHTSPSPLAWFAVFDQAQAFPVQAEDDAPAPLAHWPIPQSQAEHAMFDADMAHIHQAIAAGEFYQVNYTRAWQGRLLRGSPWAYFNALRRAQPGGYAAYLDMGCEQVLSVSPELFFDWDGARLLCRPMKGTAARGDNPEIDAAHAQALQTSPKEQAENVMIVDLIRNDVSRVAQPFSVKVPRLFHLEALPSVWQMTSDVCAQTRAGLTWVDAFAALFPCGSITGAPKVQAMKTIHALEPEARGVYCGAIGVVRPGGAARFSVAIRTVTAQVKNLRCGIGSGITASATAQGEWCEWQHKRGFLLQTSAHFDLLETFALDNGCMRNAADHWARLAQSAAHFGWTWGAPEQAALAQQVQALQETHSSGQWRVRCLVHADGQTRLEAFALEASPPSVRLAWARHALVETDSEFVRHKTTRRVHYEALTIQSHLIFDTLLYNSAGEVTECVRGNIAACIYGRWVTPPLSCGLLPGVGRAVALREGRVQEAVIRRDALDGVTAWAFLNSLRGWLPATVETM